MTRGTYRYYEATGKWHLHHMLGVAPVAPCSGELGTQPPWLVAVCDLAKIGGHEFVPPNPPPDRFFWFFLDESGTFAGFNSFVYG